MAGKTTSKRSKKRSSKHGSWQTLRAPTPAIGAPPSRRLHQQLPTILLVGGLLGLVVFPGCWMIDPAAAVVENRLMIEKKKTEKKKMTDENGESDKLFIEEKLRRLLTELQEGTEQRRWEAAISLSAIGEQQPGLLQQALPVLRAVLQEDDSRAVRYELIDALRKSSLPEALPPLLAVLQGDEDAHFRWYAAWSLGLLGAPAAVPALVKAMKEDVSPRVQAKAKEALSKIDGPAARWALQEVTWQTGVPWVPYDRHTFEMSLLFSFLFSLPGLLIEEYPADDPVMAPTVIYGLSCLAALRELLGEPTAASEHQVMLAKFKEAFVVARDYYSQWTVGPTHDQIYALRKLSYAPFCAELLGIPKEGLDFGWLIEFLSKFQLSDGSFPINIRLGYDEYGIRENLGSTKLAITALAAMGCQNQSLFNKTLEFVEELWDPIYHMYATDYDFVSCPSGLLSALTIYLALGLPIPHLEEITEKAVALGESDIGGYLWGNRNYGLIILSLLGRRDLLLSEGILAERQEAFYGLDTSRWEREGVGLLGRCDVFAFADCAPPAFQFEFQPTVLPYNKTIPVRLRITNRSPRPCTLNLVGLEPLNGSLAVEGLPELSGEVFAGNASRIYGFRLRKSSLGAVRFKVVSKRLVHSFAARGVVREACCPAVFELPEGEVEEEPASNNNRSAIILAGAILGGLLVVVGSTTAVTIVSLKKKKEKVAPEPD